MRIITIIIFAVASRLVALATAKPVLKREPGGIAIPLARNLPFLNNESISLDSITSHGISVREKILNGLDNYKMNTGTMHPFAVKRNESELGARRNTGSVPLITHQYGGWIGQISIGFPPQTLQVQFDTASADMWVVQSGFPEHSARLLNLWDPALSQSARQLKQEFQLENSAGSMSVKGIRFIDHVTIARYTAPKQTFGSATWQHTSLPGMAQYPAGGVVGLAFPFMSKLRTSPLFESLLKNPQGFDPIFSFKLSSSGAEMWVGGTNVFLYNGVVTYTPVTIPGFWHVSMDNVRASGVKILENVPVVFDTGASHIYGDWERVSNLYHRLGGTLMEHEGFGYYYLPCNSFPTLGFTFGGRTFEIPSDTLNLMPIEEGSNNCFGGIIAQRSNIGIWIIGNTFLEGVYSVFDFTRSRVGFADLA